LLMLRYFSPEEVGMFSVISQIGFFWTTLALAQTPLRLLANHGVSVFEDARHCLGFQLATFCVAITRCCADCLVKWLFICQRALLGALAVAVSIDMDACAKHALTNVLCLGTDRRSRIPYVDSITNGYSRFLHAIK